MMDSKNMEWFGEQIVTIGSVSINMDSPIIKLENLGITPELYELLLKVKERSDYFDISNFVSKQQVKEAIIKQEQELNCRLDIFREEILN